MQNRPLLLQTQTQHGSRRLGIHCSTKEQRWSMSCRKLACAQCIPEHYPSGHQYQLETNWHTSTPIDTSCASVSNVRPLPFDNKGSSSSAPRWSSNCVARRCCNSSRVTGLDLLRVREYEKNTMFMSLTLRPDCSPSMSLNSSGASYRRPL